MRSYCLDLPNPPRRGRPGLYKLGHGSWSCAHGRVGWPDAPSTGPSLFNGVVCRVTGVWAQSALRSQIEPGQQDVGNREHAKERSPTGFVAMLGVIHDGNRTGVLGEDVVVHDSAGSAAGLGGLPAGDAVPRAR